MKFFKNTLFLKIAAFFLIVLFIIGIAYISITVQSSRRYFEEQNQLLHKDLADHIMKEVEPFMYNGEVIPDKIDEIMMHMMAINPSIEVYITDVEGKILEYAAPYKKVKLDQINVAPIQTFLSNNDQPCVKGDDPRNLEKQKVFSAAAHRNDMTGEVDGYVYVILAGEEFESAAAAVTNSHMLRLGLKSGILTLLAAFLIGTIALYYLTRNLSKIMFGVKRIEEGVMDERIDLKGSGELTTLANTINSMADTILSNIEELKSTEKLRKELIANISHDLRTPLAVIHGYMETLILKEDKIEEEERRSYMNIILKNTDKLKKLVSDLFQLSLLEAKQIKPSKEPFYVNELVMDAYQKYSFLAKEKGINLQANIEENLPLIVADISMIERVFQNLLDNAIKFTKPGGKIDISLKKKDNTIAVEVRDDGVGMKTDEVEQVFERYQKFGNKSNNSSGSGLGLSIVKNILQLHNSTIRAVSQPNEGTSFQFNLPLQ